jgi:hypothetical protein
MTLKHFSSLNASSFFIVVTFSKYFNLENDASRPMSRDQYNLILKKIKKDTKMHRMKWCHDEVYLGKNRFANELHCSFNEFIANVVVTLGFLPFKVK